MGRQLGEGRRVGSLLWLSVTILASSFTKILPHSIYLQGRISELGMTRLSYRCSSCKAGKQDIRVCKSYSHSWCLALFSAACILECASHKKNINWTIAAFLSSICWYNRDNVIINGIVQALLHYSHVGAAIFEVVSVIWIADLEIQLNHYRIIFSQCDRWMPWHGRWFELDVNITIFYYLFWWCQTWWRLITMRDL